MFTINIKKENEIRNPMAVGLDEGYETLISCNLSFLFIVVGEKYFENRMNSLILICSTTLI